MAFDNSKVFGDLYGLHYTQVKVSIEKQEMVVPIFERRSLAMESFSQLARDANFTPVNLYLIGDATASESGVQIADLELPWAQGYQPKFLGLQKSVKLHLIDWISGEKPRVDSLEPVNVNEEIYQ